MSRVTLVLLLTTAVACDTWPADDRNNPYDPESTFDFDNDGVPDNEDAKPADSTFGADKDKDGIDDAKDNCLGRYNPSQNDLDNDGKGDECDNCTDRDRDGYGVNGAAGTCLGSDCDDDNDAVHEPVCGDNETCGNEVCDDGVNDGPEGECAPGCLRIQTCGDGYKDGTEFCDDGPVQGEGLCLNDCSGLQTCGDGDQEGSENCDDSYTDACGTCNATCSGVGNGPGTCGDGNLCPQYEFCDDGHQDECGDCNATCTAPGTGPGSCPDAEWCPQYETCDDGPGEGESACLDNCSGIQTCGDGDQEGTEACDDGVDNGTISTTITYCTPTCDGTQLCSNNAREGSESCDQGVDNGTISTTVTYCNPTCDGTQLCGNVAREGTETCDDGPGQGESMCLDDCSGIQSCGDGDQEGTETCDDGIDNGTISTTVPYCTPTCDGTQLCANTVEEGTETCDDGPGEGEGVCLDDCSGTQTCGDGDHEGSETCDDGLDNGIISTSVAYCTPSCDGTQLCANAAREGTEICDDGPGEGEAACLDDCSGTQTCGSTVIEGTEECDDGNTQDGDACSADCLDATEFVVATTTDNQNAAVTVLENGDFVFVWHEGAVLDRDVFFQRYDSSGLAIATAALANDSSTGEGPEVASLTTGGFVVAWESDDSGNREVFVRRFDANGNPAPEGGFTVHDPVMVTHTQADLATLANGAFVVVWKHATGAVLGRRYDQTGNPMEDYFYVRTTPAASVYEPRVDSAADGRFKAVWRHKGLSETYYYLRSRGFNSDGSPQADDYRLTSQTNGAEGSPEMVVAADGSLLVGWDSYDGPPELLVQPYLPDGTEDGPAILVQPGGSDEIGIAWLPDGGFFVAWSDPDGADGDTYGILGRRYASDYQPMGAAVVVNQYTTEGQRLEDVVSHGERVLIVWRSEGAADNSIRARLLPMLP